MDSKIQAATTSTATTATIHPGNDKEPVKSTAVSPTRSNITAIHHPMGSMADAGGGSHPKSQNHTGIIKLPLSLRFRNSHACCTFLRTSEASRDTQRRPTSAWSLQREYSSWLSLTTRSNASFAFLMRY